MPSSSEAPPSAPTSPAASSRRIRACSAVARSRSSRRSSSLATAALQRSTPAGRLEARDGGDEVPAREVVRGRERLAVGGVRILLGHRREPPRAARDDAAEGAWLAPELARDDGPIVHPVTVPARPVSAGVRPSPLGGALDDEEVLAGPDVADAARRPRELVEARGACESGGHACALGAERGDLGAALRRAGRVVSR